MEEMLRTSPHKGTPSSKVFVGVRFLLLGFTPTDQAKVASKLVSGGGVDVGEYGPTCTHLIVHNIVFDDSECVVARSDGKIVVTSLWVEHCLDVGMLVDTTSILYRPVKDLDGIPGAKSLSICLTGYQRQDRDDIMRMVGLMGAYFSKPLVANKVTHLICYKFEGEKYELAKKLKKIKLVNHRWLEDCLRAWEIIPECNYSKSGYELEIMDAEAKDSEEETEEDTNNKPLMENVVGSPSHLYSGSDPKISKAAKIPMPINQDEASKKVVSSRTEDDEKRFATIPRKNVGSDNIPALHEIIGKGEDFAGEVCGAYSRVDPYKESNELLSHPIPARSTSETSAVTPGALGYSRKTPGRSQVSKLPGMFSSRVDGSPHGVSKQYIVKDGFDVSPAKLEHLKTDLDFQQNQNLSSDAKLNLEGGNSHKLPQKRKDFLSNTTTTSPKIGAKSKACASGSPAASAKTEGSLIGFKMLERTVEKSAVGLEACKSICKSSSRENDMHRSIDFQFDKKGDPGEDQSFVISCLNSGNCEDKSTTPVDLGIGDGIKHETSSTLLTKTRLVKKVASKSKLSSGSNKQRGPLSRKTDILDGTIFSMENDNKAEHGKVDVQVENIVESMATGDTNTENKFENVAAAEDDETEAPDEGMGAELVHAAREDMIKLIPLPNHAIKKNLEELQGSTIIIGRDVDGENIATGFEDKLEVMQKDDSKNSEVGSSILKEEVVKRRKTVSNRNKKKAPSVLEKMEKSENEKDELTHVNDDEKMLAKDMEGMHCPASELPSKSISSETMENPEDKEKDDMLVDNQDPMQGGKYVSGKGKKSVSIRNKKKAPSVLKKMEKSENDKDELKHVNDDETMLVKETKETHCPASELQSKFVCSETMVNPEDKEKDDILVDNADPMHGGKYVSGKGKKTVSNRNKKRAPSVLKTMENFENDKDGLKHVNDDEKTLMKEEKRTHNPASELQSKSVSSETMENREDKEKVDILIDNANPMQGGKYVSGKGKKTVSNRNKKTAPSVLKKVEKSENDKDELKHVNDDETTLVKEMKGTHCPASELQSKPASSETMENPEEKEKDDILVDNADPMQGGKYVSGKGKKNLKSNLNKPETTVKGKKVELEKGTRDGRMEVEAKKEVQHPVSRPKNKAVTAKSAQKNMDAEKENKPIESEPLGVNLGKHKRDTVAAKICRAAKQKSKTVYGTNANDSRSGQSSKSLTSEPVWFILSGHRLQRKEFQQIIKRLKGRVCRDSHSWSYQATHFIVPDPIRRTEKFFAAAASGRWILKTDYLTASNQAGVLLPEEPYEWFKSGFSQDGAINLEAPRKWRLLRERTGHGAFYGMRVIIYGECIAPSLDTLKRVVKGGDGVILATSPPYTRFLKSAVDFAVISPGMPCGDSWVQEFLRHEIPCVAADYLVEYVCKPGSSLERHVLYKTHTWAEKSFAKLSKQLEEIVEDLRVEAEQDEEDGNVVDVPCQVCGSNDRADVLLICGDESGSLGCGAGAHIDCCNPPLEAVPEEDWFCSKCSSHSRPKKKSLSNSKRK